MVFQPEERQFLNKADLAAAMAEETPTVIDDAPLDHAREMPAAVRRTTHDAAIDVQPNPNEASLELGHLQGLINPLTDLLKARGTRPLTKLTITRSKTKPRIGDEEYLEKDIRRIGEFMRTEKYEQLAAPVKESIATYLGEQEQALRELEALASSSEVDRTDVIRLKPRPSPAKPLGRMAGFLKRLGIG